MVMKANNEVEIDEEDEDEKMPPLEDVNDVCVKNMIEVDALVIRRALNMHFNMAIWKVKQRTYSIRDVMFIIRCVT